MAKPRVFVSSTYYDLKHIRASLDLFINSLGFEPVLSEKGSIAYLSEEPPDISCYREAQNSDIFVLIVGGRYGSEHSGEKLRDPTDFFKRYDSITRKEYENAFESDIPIYILFEHAVYAEYQTYLRNKEVTSISYAHVENVNVFVLIEEILSKRKNNAYRTFEKYDEIEDWLKDQWAGLFRELLKKQSQSTQLSGLSAQVAELKATNETLKKYLESVMLKEDLQESTKLIEKEQERLLALKRHEIAATSRYISYIAQRSKSTVSDIISALLESNTREDFVQRVNKINLDNGASFDVEESLRNSHHAREELNQVRVSLDLQAFPDVAGDKVSDRVIKIS